MTINQKQLHSRMSMAGCITTIPEPYRSFFTGQTDPPGIWLSAKPDLGVRLVVACIWIPCCALPGLLVALMPFSLLLPPQRELRHMLQSLGQANLLEWLLFGGLILLIASVAAVMLLTAQATNLYRAWRAVRGDRYGILLTPKGLAARLIDFRSGPERLWRQHNCFWFANVTMAERSRQQEQDSKGRPYYVSYISLTASEGNTLWLREDCHPNLWPPLERWWRHTQQP